MQEREFKYNWVKTYALVWESYCSWEVKMLAKEMKHFETVVKNQPLVLLEQMESLIHTLIRAKYPSLMVIEILCIFLVNK